VWGVGWGYQDVRGEDAGILDASDGLTNADDLGPRAINVGTVSVTNGSTTVNGGGTYAWPTADDELIGGTFFVWPSGETEFDVTDPDNDVYQIVDSTSTSITLNREYEGTTDAAAAYRIIEPTQANGVLDESGGTYPEDLGADGLANDPLDSLGFGSATGIPNNVGDNDGTTAETSFGEGNKRLDSRVMGIWDSRSPDPRNPRMAAELDGTNTGFTTSGADDDQDSASGIDDDDPTDAAASPETDDDLTPNYDESNDLIDDDADGIADDRFYEPAGKADGMNDPGEADTSDDSLPKAVRITIAIRDSQQSLNPVVLGTTVWLSTAR
jgi:hypothetical protein